MNTAGLARAELKNLLALALHPMPVLLDSEAPGNAQAYARISPAGIGDTYDAERRVLQNPRFQVDIYTYAVSDSDALKAGDLAERAAITAGWTILHPRSPLGFEGQTDANKRRWYSFNFDAEALYTA